MNKRKRQFQFSTNHLIHGMLSPCIMLRKRQLSILKKVRIDPHVMSQGTEIMDFRNFPNALIGHVCHILRQHPRTFVQVKGVTKKDFEHSKATFVHQVKGANKD